MERRNLSSSYADLFNGCLIVKRRLSTHNVVRGVFTGHGGHGNALLLLQCLCLVVDFSLCRQFSPESFLSNSSMEERV